MDGINNRIKLIKMSLCAKLNKNIKIPKEDRLERWIVFEMICNVLQYAAYTDVHNIRYDMEKWDGNKEYVYVYN